jgi:hypothetical protein
MKSVRLLQLSVGFVSLAAALIGVPSHVSATQCGGQPDIPADAIGLLRGRGVSELDGYAVGVVEAKARMVDAVPTWKLDVRMQLIFKGDVPQAIPLFDVPLNPPVDFQVGHQYFFALTTLGGQPAGIPYGLAQCGPSFEIDPGGIGDLVAAAPPIKIYDETMMPHGGQASNWALPGAFLVAFIVGALVFMAPHRLSRRRGHDGSESVRETTG